MSIGLCASMSQGIIVSLPTVIHFRWCLNKLQRESCGGGVVGCRGSGVVVVVVVVAK